MSGTTPHRSPREPLPANALFITNRLLKSDAFAEAEFRDDIQAWCEAELKGEWHHDYRIENIGDRNANGRVFFNIVVFELERDAVLFKLWWL